LIKAIELAHHALHVAHLWQLDLEKQKEEAEADGGAQAVEGPISS
jgi:hypothetical protein